MLYKSDNKDIIIRITDHHTIPILNMVNTNSIIVVLGSNNHPRISRTIVVHVNSIIFLLYYIRSLKQILLTHLFYLSFFPSNTTLNLLPTLAIYATLLLSGLELILKISSGEKSILDWFYRMRKSELKNIVTKIVEIQV